MGHITFVHGIANKPERDVLLEQWRVALYDNDGVDLDDLDVTSSMVYWADLLYANPAPPGGMHESAELELQRTTDPGDADMTWLAGVDPAERAFVDSVAREIGFESVEATPGEGDDPIRPGGGLEAVPLPPGLKRRLMRIFLRDVHHYLYDEPFSPRGGEKVRIRREVRSRTAQALREGTERGGPHLVIGHSLGSVIAYDVLTSDDDIHPVDAFLTVGSPLGISEIRERLEPSMQQNGWPTSSLGRGPWINVYDLLDPVCGFKDRRIAPSFRADGRLRVTDIEVTNEGRWRHSISKYLGQELLRDHIREIFE
jgi:hypothetical protein